MTTARPLSDVVWDETLIRKYNIKGPRYTSYPTAVQFHDISAMEAEHHLMQQPATGPLSLYIHIPFCRHLCYYCGCNKIASKSVKQADDYLDRLALEMANTARFFGQRSITQLHLGGGTPTFLNESQMERLLDLVSQHYLWQPETTAGEYSIELDPRETSPAMLKLLRERGFNRLSFGIQDFNEATQVAIHRVQPLSLVQPLIEQSRALEFESLNFDLIYGLPHQNTITFDQTLTQVIALNPDRISLYNYAHLPERFPAQKRLGIAGLPNPETKLQLMQLAIARLQDAGYRYIGMDHFARSDDSLCRALDEGTLQRNFQGYATQAETDMLALGVSGISQIGGATLQNHTDLEHYQNRIDNGQLAIRRGFWLSEDDIVRRAAINALACQGRLNFADFDRQHGLHSRQYFSASLNQLKRLQADGLVQLSNQAVTVTELGRLILRPILMAFDAYLEESTLNSFSKVL